ncbi:hypothetical protein [Pseudoxanthomonas mexicana]|uniref:hypothetical protein n=1 Tax=Pseudoxanthomonas mexicana TaxID=128785 RepID=UPI0028A669F5|nr:hypothetical protein [Pseudoxanthomonas mexicana]
MKSIAYGSIALLALCLLPGCANGRATESMNSRVSRLIDEATKSEKAAQKAFNELESLGNQAVPYLVGNLDDMRPLAAREITLENRASDAFEGLRHYGPETVHDALAAILSQATGKSFIIVYNGATPNEREENRVKWVEWCQEEFPAQAATCRGQ